MKGFLSRSGIFLLLCLLMPGKDIYSQSFPQEKQGDVYVDGKGVMRWGHNKQEVKGFGVNYSVPFAHAYRSAQKLDVDVKKAIDNDVYHFARLGFDLYRIHVWDTQISDVKGNLLENEHLEVFDYLLKKLKERGINFVITPIAFWGSGWPEPDPETPGFSHKYGKAESLTDPEAITAQQNYLKQFLEHVNPYTGAAYKDEPNIIAFEVSNEPHHRGTPEEVTNFIEKMVGAMRSTGTAKPIFYNISHSVHLMETYFKASMDGGTFQWYPTGLGFGKELRGNLLPNVNDYNIPFDSVIRKNKGAKLVYEFDAADVNKSYVYPAMARSFREAGIQVATHFAYDPTYMAYANTEYNTHFMNLAFSPSKALALMISSEIFHDIPMYKDQGQYPENLQFGNYSISYEEDLAVMNTSEKFIYTNDNSVSPKAPKKLKMIAGYGNSQLVEYEGTGAYFLDRLAPGIWRLEVMPDAILVANPFGRNNLDKKVAVINRKEWPMKLNLPDLSQNFSLSALNIGNDHQTTATNGTFRISPGAYLLKKPSAKKDFTGEEQLGNISLNEFNAPATTVEKIYVVHDAVPELKEEGKLQLRATIVSPEEIGQVRLLMNNGNQYDNLEMKRSKAYEYVAEVPSKLLQPGYLNYSIVVETEGKKVAFPAGVEGSPYDWDFYREERYTTRISPKESPLYLFNAVEDRGYIVGKWLPGNQLVPTKELNEAEYQVKIEQLFEPDPENKFAPVIYDYSFRFHFSEKIKGRKDELPESQRLVLKGRSLSDKPEKLQLAVLNKDGTAFGGIISLLPGEQREYEINIADLKPVKTVTLPRPYPTFLPYYFEHNNPEVLELSELEALQISVGPGMEAEELKQPHQIAITEIRLEK